VQLAHPMVYTRNTLLFGRRFLGLYGKKVYNQQNRFHMLGCFTTLTHHAGLLEPRTLVGRLRCKSVCGGGAAQ
jgi:hypothetical protein